MSDAGRLGDIAKIDKEKDKHGCPACPHTVAGPAIIGSPTVVVNGRPALRATDKGIHSSCCGTNTWTALEGSATVRVNGLPFHRKGDKTEHCGGTGALAEGSSNVAIGGPSVK